MRPCDNFNAVQLINGFVFLVTGISIYVLFRGDTLPYLPEAWVVHGLLPYPINHLTNQLPTFTHLLAFSLFTAGILGGGRRSAVLICLFWLFVETVFETAQHPLISGWLAPRVPRWFENIALLDHTRGFLISGTFDPLDLVAATLAALLAYVVIRITGTRRISFQPEVSQKLATHMGRRPL